MISDAPSLAIYAMLDAACAITMVRAATPADTLLSPHIDAVFSLDSYVAAARCLPLLRIISPDTPLRFITPLLSPPL